jgi:hypothetical protein
MSLRAHALKMILITHSASRSPSHGFDHGKITFPKRLGFGIAHLCRLSCASVA